MTDFSDPAWVGALLAENQVGLWSLDPEGMIVAGDQVLRDLFEIANAEAPSDDYLQAIHPEDRPRVSALLSQSVSSRTSLEAEFRAGGRFLLARGRFDDSQGSLRGFVVDASRWLGLRRNDEEFQTLANTIGQLAWMAHADGNIFWYNQRWFEYTGTTLEDMQGWGWQSVHDPAVLPLVLERWKDSIQTGQPFEMEFPLRGADGVLRTFLTRVEPIRDEESRVLRWFGTNTDIDEQRRSVERTRTLVEATSQAIFTADGQGQLQTPSSSWMELTGQNWADMRGSGWLEAIHPQDRNRVAQAWSAATQTGQTFSQEFRLWSALNRFVQIRAKGVPVVSRAGQVLEWIVANTDVTEQVEAQQQLQERARYAAFRTTLKEVLNSSSTWPETAERCCAALTAQLELRAGGLWELREGELTLIARDGPLPEGFATSPLLLSLTQSPRGSLLNSLTHLGQEGWQPPAGLEAIVSHPLLQNGRCVGLLVGFSERILPVNLAEELRDAAEALANWLRNHQRLRAAEELLEACRSALPPAENKLRQLLDEHVRYWA